MKTFRMIGTALFAILMSVNFASCSTDDDDPTDEEGSSTTQPSDEKKLVRMLVYNVGETNEELDDILKFEYDEEGNLETIYDGWGNYIDTIKYIWDSSKSVAWRDLDGGEWQWTLVDGKMKDAHLVGYEWRPDWENGGDSLIRDFYTLDYYCAYNNDGYIQEFGNPGDPDKITFTWDSGKLSMIEDGEDRDVITFRYDNQVCKGFFPLFGVFESLGFWDYTLTAQLELSGMKMNAIPSKIYAGNTTMTIETELDTDGYVVGCSVNELYKDEYNNHSSGYFYEFVWE
jgi:hypothetical protein